MNDAEEAAIRLARLAPELIAALERMTEAAVALERTLREQAEQSAKARR